MQCKNYQNLSRFAKVIAADEAKPMIDFALDIASKKCTEIIQNM